LRAKKQNEMIESSRRGFITGLIALGVAAPAIVRAASIMPVKVMHSLSLGGVPIVFDDPAIQWPYAQAVSTGQMTPEIAELLQRRIDAAEQIFAASLRESFDRVVYREGTGASDGLTALFNG